MIIANYVTAQKNINVFKIILLIQLITKLYNALKAAILVQD